uniref:Bifunctional inhibitor/plant lipid transfer protein/seed storage helical domain-containing protein n=1 Tax=Oryza brachyantha TaxID=4533 RepID=J3MMR6_ORYBR
MATYKILALFALLALSASATTAITTMQYFSPTVAANTMDPCRQYMMQTLGRGGYTTMLFMSQPAALLQQQCCMQLQGMVPQCRCGTSCHMLLDMQQAICGGLMQPQMKMAMQLPNMCNSMAPNYQFSPYDCC